MKKLLLPSKSFILVLKSIIKYPLRLRAYLDIVKNQPEWQKQIPTPANSINHRIKMELNQ